MSNKWLASLVVLVIILLAGFYLYRQSKNTNSYQQALPPQASVSPEQSALPAASSSAKEQQSSVSLTKDGYQPKTLTVKAGSTVTWTNNSGAVATVNSNPHPAHTQYPSLNLSRFEDGQSLSLTFNTPGTYSYHNHLNASQTGTIVVQ